MAGPRSFGHCLGSKKHGPEKAAIAGPLRTRSGDTLRALGSEYTSRKRIRNDDNNKVKINLYMGAMNARHNSETA